MNRRMPSALLVPGVLLLASVGWIADPTSSRRTAPDASAVPPVVAGGASARGFFVATYNIEHGYRVADASGKIVRLFKQLKPDIVCLQEARWRTPPSGAVTGHPVAIAEALGGRTWCVADRRPAGGTAHAGLAIITRGTILRHEVLQFAGEKPYGLLAEIEIDGVRLIVVSVHLRSLRGATVRGVLSTEGDRVRQVRHLTKRLKRETVPVIVAGDFNALPIFPSRAIIAARYRDAARAMHDASYTRKTRGIGARIDYIFTSPLFTVERYAVPPVDYSDHRPVTAYVTLAPDRLPPPAPGPTRRR